AGLANDPGTQRVLETAPILVRLEEAVRRDIHFLARHPTTLFQCLWNSGWWYDGRDARDHFLTADGEFTREFHDDAPWYRIAPRVSEFLQQWKQRRAHWAAGSIWLR